ncbi:hypothetical protein [Achromobacter sp. DH1f]|uniref:hypothetical protein n=1 Tax=Achromobacter sp. DH1f TaxID=1397275 RepID=UPI000468A21E|nr:hypothetical protein [Achromobacter sp. DH1f]
MTANTTRTLDRYREVVAFALANTHHCPPEVIAAQMNKYEDVLRACWSVGVAPVDVIDLLYAEWKVFRSK